MESRKPIRVAQIMGKLCAGGVETVIFNYYRNIDHRKIQFDFYYDGDSTVGPPQDLIDMGAQFYEVPPYQELPRYLRALRRAFREKRYPIVHSNLNSLSVFPLYAAKKEKIPVRIAHNHATAGEGALVKNAVKLLLRCLSTRYPTQLCACSRYAGEWLYGTSDFYVVKNAIDVKRFLYNEEKRAQERKRLGLEHRFVVGHVGRFCHDKNHEFLLEVFAEICKLREDAVLLLVGGGKLEAPIRKKAEQLGVLDRVWFAGIQKDTSAFYQAMDVFVLPSRSEGLGVVLIEAQACSLPILCSDRVPEEAKVLDSMTFLSLNESPRAWAERALEEAEQSKRYDTEAEMQKAGFDIATEAKKLEAFYQSLLT